MKIITWPPTSTTLKLAGAAVLGLIILLMILGYGRYSRNLAIAEEQEKSANILAAKNKENEEQRRKDEEQRQTEREASEKLIQANMELASKFASTVAQRDRDAATRQAALLAPKPISQVVEEARKILGIEPKVQPDNTFSLTKEQLQDFIAMKDRVEQLTANAKDNDRQLRLLQDTIDRLQKDKESYEKSLAAKDETIKSDKTLIEAQNTVIQSYKSVAKRSGLRKALEFGGRAGLTVGLAYLGARAASR